MSRYLFKIISSTVLLLSLQEPIWGLIGGIRKEKALGRVKDKSERVNGKNNNNDVSLYSCQIKF